LKEQLGYFKAVICNDFSKMWGQNRTADPTPKSGGQFNFWYRRWALRIAATDFAVKLAFWKMVQLECLGTKMGCSDTVLVRAQWKKIRGNIAALPCKSWSRLFPYVCTCLLPL